MIEMFEQHRHFRDDKIFDPFLNVLLNMTSWQLQYFQSYIIAAKIVLILALQVFVYLQAGSMKQNLLKPLEYEKRN